MMTIHDRIPNEPTAGDVAQGACVAPGATIEAAPQLVSAALGKLGDAELHSLGVVTHELLQVAPDFVWWIGRLANWETNRRAGLESSWPPDPNPGAPSSQDVHRIAGALLMRRRIGRQSSRHARALVSFFDVLVGATRDRGSLQRTELRAAA